MKKIAMALIAASTLALVAPASATIYTYTQTNGAVLTINNETNTGTLIGNDINSTFTSSDFANFTGGPNPTGSFNLDSLDGYRVIRGQRYGDNPSHQQKLIISASGRTNLWSYWGNGARRYGDYITRIGGYTPPTPTGSSGSSGGSTGGGSTGGTDVPAPGMLVLFGLGAGAVALRRRRKKAEG